MPARSLHFLLRICSHFDTSREDTATPFLLRCGTLADPAIVISFLCSVMFFIFSSFMQAGASSAPLMYRVPRPAYQVRAGAFHAPGFTKTLGQREHYAPGAGGLLCVQRGAVKPHAVPAATGKISQPFTDTAPCRKIPCEPDGSSGTFSGISGRLIGYPVMARSSTTRTSIMIASPLRFIRRAAGTHDLQCPGNADVREHCD
jgi:hypothetical protein